MRVTSAPVTLEPVAISVTPVTAAPISTPASYFAPVGPLNKGVAMTDGNLGSKTWYIIYSAIKLADRFTDTQLWQDTAEHLIGVR